VFSPVSLPDADDFNSAMCNSQATPAQPTAMAITEYSNDQIIVATRQVASLLFLAGIQWYTGTTDHTDSSLDPGPPR